MVKIKNRNCLKTGYETSQNFRRPKWRQYQPFFTRFYCCDPHNGQGIPFIHASISFNGAFFIGDLCATLLKNRPCGSFKPLQWGFFIGARSWLTTQKMKVRKFQFPSAGHEDSGKPTKIKSWTVSFRFNPLK
jgi:hypothetical protein